MKYLIFGFAFFNIFFAEACKCGFTPVTDHYQNSDFVAIGKILKVYPNESEEEIYKADIQLLDLIKGPEISSIYVRGRSDGKKGSSCAIYTPEDTNYIFFARKDKNGRMVFGYCSGTRNLDEVKEQSPYLLDLLEILKNQKEDYSGKPDPTYYSDFFDRLTQFEGKTFSQKFALYEVQFKEDLSVKRVKVIEGFGKETDRRIRKELELASWKSRPKEGQPKSPKGSKKLVGVFYYESDDTYPSFLSVFDF